MSRQACPGRRRQALHRRRRSQSPGPSLFSVPRLPAAAAAMGKRKSSAKPPPKKARPKLETTFACPICNASKSVTCELRRDENLGVVRCSQCKAGWSMEINQLSEPIDVYR